MSKDTKNKGLTDQEIQELEETLSLIDESNKVGDNKPASVGLKFTGGITSLPLATGGIPLAVSVRYLSGKGILPYIFVHYIRYRTKI